MLRSMILVLALSSAAFAQEASNTVVVRGQGMVSVSAQTAPIQGAPYSATIANESIQTLADGNRIVQTSTGTTARDAQGRSRQDTALPAIGNLSAANAPHLVFIQDPVAQTSYVLNLTEKTAQRLPMPPALPRRRPRADCCECVLHTIGHRSSPRLPRRCQWRHRWRYKGRLWQAIRTRWQPRISVPRRWRALS